MTLRIGPEALPTAGANEDGSGARKALEDLGALPSLRNQIRRFATTLEPDYCLLDDVVAEVSRDPALTVNVLRVANSVAVGSRERIVDLGTALQMMGVLRVRLMAQLLLAMEDARGVAPGFDWTSLWLHSAACASLVDRLDQWSGMKAGPEGHLAGLLHDVGKIALSAVAPGAYRAILVEAWAEGRSLPALESARLGLDHHEAGLIVVREAELPPAVLSAIACHDAPDRAPAEHRALVAAVAVANRLVKAHGFGFSGNDASAADDLGTSPAWRTWAAALGHDFDAADLAARVEEWLEPLRAELQAIGGGG